MDFDDKVDYGLEAVAFNLKEVAVRNKFYRRAVWTGEDMQLTVMDIPPKGDIGLEKHDDVEQMLFVYEGVGTVYMGESEDKVSRLGEATPGYVVIVPKGTYHNIVNNHRSSLKLASIYAPPHHKKGAIHKTKEEAMEEEHGY